MLILLHFPPLARVQLRMRRHLPPPPSLTLLALSVLALCVLGQDQRGSKGYYMFGKLYNNNDSNKTPQAQQDLQAAASNNVDVDVRLPPPPDAEESGTNGTASFVYGVNPGVDASTSAPDNKLQAAASDYSGEEEYGGAEHGKKQPYIISSGDGLQKELLYSGLGAMIASQTDNLVTTTGLTFKGFAKTDEDPLNHLLFFVVVPLLFMFFNKLPTQG